MKIAKYWKQLQAEIVRKEQKLDIPANGGFRTSKQVINGVELDGANKQAAFLASFQK